jgi:two-component system sensor histidine kinase and response regulator WspE
MPADLADLALVELFQSEVDLHAQTLTDGLLALERDPAQLDVIDGLMRAAHSIKGAARIVGVEPCVQVAHVMEDVLVAAQENRLRLTPTTIDVLLRGTDTIVQVAKISAAPLDDWLASHGAALRQLLADLHQCKQPAPTSPPRPVATPTPVGPPTHTPTGDLTASAAQELRAQLQAWLLEPPTTVRLNLSAVRDIHPAGLVVLAGLSRSPLGQRVELSQVDPSVALLLRHTGIPLKILD